MSFLTIEQVTELPTPVAALTMYIVRSATAGLVDLYFTNIDGTDIRHVISQADIQTLVTTMVGSATSSLTDVKIVPNIVARNALTLTANGLAMVLDATGDSTVTAGAALYIYDVLAAAWYKVAEYESMDFSWSALTGAPTSSAVAIDQAVAASHSHLNAATLDKIGEDAQGNFLFNGIPPKAPLAVVQW